MTINPYESSLDTGQPAVKKPGGIGAWVVQLLVVVGIIGLLIALLLPAVRFSPEAARRAQCSNHLKQIGLALHNYEDEYGCLPPAYTVDADGKPLHSWRTLILPYLEQRPLYETIDLSKPWDDPANQQARETRVRTYECPSAAAPDGHTTYLAIVGPTSCFQATQPRPLSEIADGTSRTLMVIEVAPSRAVPWMSPADASEQEVLDAVAAKQSSHPSGTHGLFADCSIRFLRSPTPPEDVRAWISIAGNDNDRDD